MLYYALPINIIFMSSALHNIQRDNQNEEMISLLLRHNEHDSVSNHQPQDCILNRLFRRRSKKTSKPCVTGLCVGNLPGTGEFPEQMASNAENVSIRWRHHVSMCLSKVVADGNRISIWITFLTAQRILYASTQYLRMLNWYDVWLAQFHGRAW